MTGTYPVGPRLTVPGAAPTCALVDGVVLRGSNLVPKASDLATGQAFRSMFATWDWGGWVKWQVDLAISAGANCVRLIGDLLGVNDGTFTSAYYLACWEQLIDYCAAQGIYLSAAGGGVSQVSGLSSSVIETALVNHATLLDGYPATVVGFDIVQESTASWAPTNAASVSAAVRAVTDIPITYSHAVTATSGFRGPAWRDALQSHVDYFDAHFYIDPLPFVLYDGYWSKGETKPLLIGEIGASVAEGQAAQSERYEAGVVVARKRDLSLLPAGTLTWAITDQGTADGDKWGMWDTSGTPRSHLLNAFARLPTTP